MSDDLSGREFACERPATASGLLATTVFIRSAAYLLQNVVGHREEMSRTDTLFLRSVIREKVFSSFRGDF